MDRALIEQKVESLRRCVQRIGDKCLAWAEDHSEYCDFRSIRVHVRATTFVGIVNYGTRD